MKTPVGSGMGRWRLSDWREVSEVLPVAIALLLTGCPAATTSISESEPGSAASNSASLPMQADLKSSATPSTPTERKVQPSPTPTAATKNNANEKEAVRQAVLNDPSINASLRREFERVPGRSPELLHPLEVGAIAIAENYALAEVFGGVGDLVVIDGYYLLKKQNRQWIVVNSVGGFGGEIAIDRLTNLGLSDTTIQNLLDALRAIGANFTVVNLTEISTDTPTIPREQVVLGGISPDTTVAEVKQRLGQPLSEKVEETECCGSLVNLEYPNFSLGLLQEGGVFQMSATHRDVATGAGVRVGDTHEAVTNAYGSPSVADGEVLIYYVSGSDESESFSFSLEGGRVAEIRYSALLN